MGQSERRILKRYVVDGLKLDLNGVLHETVDLSVRAVALVQRAGVDYSRPVMRAVFFCSRAGELEAPVRIRRLLAVRGPKIVFGYEVDVAGWEELLRANDVRAGLVALEDVFG